MRFAGVKDHRTTSVVVELRLPFISRFCTIAVVHYFLLSINNEQANIVNKLLIGNRLDERHTGTEHRQLRY